MRIMVYDVAATDSGALSVLNEFYNLALKNCNEGGKTIWYFVVSTPKLKSISNVIVIKKDWVKKSWIHRFFYEVFILNKTCKELKIDRFVSLQNVGVDFVRAPQIVYFHNSIPFNEKRFSLFENTKLWVYQNIIKNIYKNSLKNSYKIITQTSSMRTSILKNIQISESKVINIMPTISMPDIVEQFKYNTLTKNRFFYPATAYEYKNHMVVLEAFKILSERGVIDYTLFLTINFDENRYTRKLNDFIEENNLNVKFLGKISKNAVFEYYVNSILVFPSYIESCPFPLIEAQYFNTIIISTSCDFSKEILNNYSNKYLFDPYNANELSQLIQNAINGKNNHNLFKNISNNNRNILNEILN